MEKWLFDWGFLWHKLLILKAILQIVRVKWAIIVKTFYQRCKIVCLLSKSSLMTIPRPWFDCSTYCTLKINVPNFESSYVNTNAHNFLKNRNSYQKIVRIFFKIDHLTIKSTILQNHVLHISTSFLGWKLIIWHKLKS